MAEGGSTPPTNNNNNNINNSHNPEFNFELDDDILKNLVNQVEHQEPPEQQENKELLELNISVDALHDLVNQTVDILEHEPPQEQQNLPSASTVVPGKEKNDAIESSLLDKLVQDTVGLLEQVGEDHNEPQQQPEISQEVAVPEDVLSALVSSTVGALEKQKEVAESDELGDAIREALMQHQNPQEEQPKEAQIAEPDSLSASASQPHSQPQSQQPVEQPTHDLEIPQELLKKLASQTFEHIQQESSSNKILSETEDSDALQAALEQMVKNVVESNVEPKAAPVQASSNTASSGKEDELDLTAMLQNAMQMAMQNPADLLSNMEQALKADTGKAAPKKRKPKEKSKSKEKEKELEKQKKLKEKEEKLAKEKERQKELERLRIEKEKELAKQKEIEKQKELAKQKEIEKEKAAAAAAAAAKAAPPKKVSLSIAETLALTRAKMNNLHRTSTPSDLPAARAPDPRTLIAAQRPSTPSSTSSSSKSRVGKFSNWTNLSYTALKAMTGTLLTTFSKLESASGVTYIDKAVQAENDDMYRMPLGDSPEDIKERNRIRKQKWRERNTEKNKDHDLRARLMKRALQLFPEEERESERKAWCEKEFETRKQRRIARENEIAHEMSLKASTPNSHSESASPAPTSAPTPTTGNQPHQQTSPQIKQAPPKPTTISESLALAGVKVDSIPGLTDPNLLRNLATVYNTFGNVPGSDSESAVATTATAVASAYTVANKDEKSLEKQHLTEILKTMLNSLLELMPPAVPTENTRIEHIVGSIPGVPRGVISFKVRRDKQVQRSPQQITSSKSTLPSKQPDMGLTALVKKPNKLIETDASTATDSEKRKADETIESILKRQRTEAVAIGSTTTTTTVGNKIMPWAVSFKPPQYKKPGGAFPSTGDANRSVSPAISSSSTASVSASPQMPPQQKPILLGATSLRSGSPTPSLGMGGGLRKPGAFRKPQGYATPAGAQKSPSPNRPFSGIQFRKV